MKNTSKILALALFLTPMTFLISCEKQETPEEKIEDAADAVGDAVEDTADAIEDAAEDAQN